MDQVNNIHHRERRCICNHDESNHIFDESSSICSREGCNCVKFHLWEVFIADPTGKVHEIWDIAKFVRDHQELFQPHEVIYKAYYDEMKHEWRKWCLAESILYLLSSGHQDWSNGWHIVTLPKKFYGKTQ